MSLPERITAMAVTTYTVKHVVEALKYAGMENADSDIEAILDYIEADSADYFGTNNLIFQDENGESL